MKSPRRSARLTTAVLALALATAASAAFAAATPEEPPSAAQVKALLGAGRHEEARAMGESLLADLEARGVAESAEGAELLDLLLWAARWRRDSSEEARRLGERAIALRERVNGPESPALATTLWSAGVLRMMAGDYEAARPRYDRCLAIREKVLGPDDPAVAEVLLESANLLQRQGRFTDAVPLYERALAIREKRLGPNHPDVASVLHNMGNLRLRMGDYVQARADYQRALDIRRTALGPRHIDVGLTLITMGVLFQNMGDYEKAREVLEQAIPICRETVPPNMILLATALNNLGNVHWSVGEARKARDAYREALDIKLKVLGPDHPDLVDVYNNLAVAHKALGELDAAIPLYEQAVRLVEKNLGRDHFFLGEVLNNLANVQVLKGRLAEARPLYERSLSIRMSIMGRRHPESAETLTNLAGLDLLEGRRVEALSQAVEASDSTLALLRDTFAYLPERSALALASSRAQSQSVLFDGLRTAKEDEAAWLEACWNFTLQRKGIVLEEMAERHRATLDDERPQTRAAWEELARARTDLGELWVGSPGSSGGEAYQAKLKAATDRKESAEARLADLSAPYRNQRLRRRADVGSVQRLLRPGETLVEIIRVAVGQPAADNRPSHDFALILAPGGARAWKDLGPSEATDRRIASWREALSRAFEVRGDASASAPAMTRLEETGQEVRKAIWDPISRSIAGARLVLMAPDGPLHQVDFAALPSGPGRYLLEEAPPFQVIGSGRDLLARDPGASMPSPARQKGLLALGSPDFAAKAGSPLPSPGSDPVSLRSAAAACEPLRDRTWSPLPEAAREVRTIADLVKDREPVTVLTGDRAREETFGKDAPRARLLHLATHGFFLDSCGGDVSNPLLLSGLVLSGANHAGGKERTATSDGILTAEEIVGMDLRGVDLTVLSACDTGRGEVAAGEGVFGLRRALEIAGVRTIVMSLWPVPDRQARRWMVDFYRGHLIEGAAAFDAARRASLSILEDLRTRGVPTHPYMWTGFVVAGAADR